MTNRPNDNYARVDKGFALAPIFSANVSNIATPICIEQRSKTLSIDYLAPRHCGAREQSVLFGLIAKTSCGAGRPLARLTKAGEPSALWIRATGVDSYLEGDALPSVVAIDISGRELIQLAGLRSDGAENYAALKTWLDGLAGVSIRDHFAPRKATQQLLAFRELENGYRIALCPRLSASSLGSGGNVTIQLEERDNISSAAGKLLHAKLSANLHAGASFRIGKEKLAAAIWPDICPPRYPANWKSTIGSALNELANVGWLVNIESGVVRIERPPKEGRAKQKPKEDIVEP